VSRRSTERQTELVLEQLKLCMETVGSSLEERFEVHRLLHIGADVPRRQWVYAKFFPKNPPARMFVNPTMGIACWARPEPGHAAAGPPISFCCTNSAAISARLAPVAALEAMPI
jgi:hypothetical protein